jgi:hypothetical protein
METTKTDSVKSSKNAKSKPSTDSLRVRKETKKKVLGELVALNKKEFGKPVSPDQYVALAISLLRPEHLKQLQDQSLTAKDRFDQKYRDYCTQNGKVSKDEYLGVLLGD